MKEKVMITKIQNNIFRLVLGTTESDVFYIAKGIRGSWKIAQSGTILDFANSKAEAIKLATQLHQGA
jgi:hypothetical protein